MNNSDYGAKLDGICLTCTCIGENDASVQDASNSVDSASYIVRLLSLPFTRSHDSAEKIGCPESWFCPNWPYFPTESEFFQNSGRNLQLSMNVRLRVS